MGFFNFITGKKNAPPPTTATPTAASSPAAQKANVVKSGILGRSFTRGVNYVPAEEVSDFASNAAGKRLTAYLNKARLNNAKLADKSAYVNTEFDYEDVVNNGKTGPKKEKKTLRARFYGRNNGNAARTYRNFRKTLSNSKKSNFNKKEKAFQSRLSSNVASASKSAAAAAAAAAKEQAYAAAGRSAPVAKPSILNAFGRKANTKSASSAPASKNVKMNTKNPMFASKEGQPLAGQANLASTKQLNPAQKPVNVSATTDQIENAERAAASQRLNAELSGIQVGQLPASKSAGVSPPPIPPPGSKLPATAAVPPPAAGTPPKPANRVGEAFTNAVVAPAIQQAEAVQAGQQQMAANMAAAQAKAAPGIMANSTGATDPFSAAAKAIGLAGGKRRRHMSRKKRHMKKQKSRKH